MTSTVLQRPAITKITTTSLDKQQTAKATKATTRSRNTMAWSHEKLRFSCIDNIGLKQLWKLIALDTANATTPTTNNNNNSNNRSGNVEQPKASSNINNSNINNEVSYWPKESFTRESNKMTTVTSMQSYIRVESNNSRESDPSIRQPLPTQFADLYLYLYIEYRSYIYRV